MKWKFNFIIFYMVCIVFASSCAKQENPEQVTHIQSILFASDHLLSTQLIALDFLMSHTHDSGMFLPHFQSYTVQWFDSSFDDGNGIEGIVSFIPLSNDSVVHYYGNDFLVRVGSLKIKADKPFSHPESIIELETSMDYAMGYNPFKLYPCYFNSKIQRTNSISWEFLMLDFRRETAGEDMKGEISGSIIIKEEILKNQEIEFELNGQGSYNLKSFSMKTLKNLNRKYNSDCGMSFNKGELELELNKELWNINYNSFNQEPCDRMVKVSKGRKEYFVEIL